MTMTWGSNMTNPKNQRSEKNNLPCQWVDEKGFDVTPSHGPAPQPPSSETGFLLKPKAPRRPAGSPDL
jgi:hypothetical protein